MLSKFLNVAARCPPVMLKRKLTVPLTNSDRVMSTYMVPPNQYDMPWPKKLQIIYVLGVYWETVPLFVCTAISLALIIFAIYHGCANKVDVVFKTRSRENISRTMDLRNPSVHKVITINQQYLAWPEMQDVLDKMIAAEKRALVRARSCASP